MDAIDVSLVKICINVIHLFFENPSKNVYKNPFFLSIWIMKCVILIVLYLKNGDFLLFNDGKNGELDIYDNEENYSVICVMNIHMFRFHELSKMYTKCQ